MIQMSQRLKEVIERYPTIKCFADIINMDYTLVFKIVKGERAVSKTFIENVMKYLNWRFEDGFKIDRKEEPYTEPQSPYVSQ